MGRECSERRHQHHHAPFEKHDGCSGGRRGGYDEYGGGARYGARFGEDATYRIYAKGFSRDDTVTETGSSADDSWHKWQVGFRTDWGKAGNEFTVQGDAYDGSINQAANDEKTIAGGNLLGRWNKTFRNGSDIQVQAYYDRTRRIYPGVFKENLYTYDIGAQHHFLLGAHHDVVWGGGYRLMVDKVTNTAALAFLPPDLTLGLANVFIQDQISFVERLQLTLGIKLENNSYTGLEFQPNARLAWKLRDTRYYGRLSRVP